MRTLSGRAGSPVADEESRASAARRMGRPVAFPVTVALAVGLSLVLRLRFFFTPMTADEGGFLAIARAWRHGARLYHDVWVDRPQGLLVVFRAVDVLGGGRLVALRAAAFVFGAVAVVSGAWLCRTLAGDRAGAIAALVLAVAVSAPAVEGFTPAGELLSGAIATTAVALAGWVVVRRGPTAAMAAAGALAVLAVGVKQSAYDAALAIGLWLVLVLVRGWVPRPEAAALLVRYVAGGAATAAVFVVDGARYGSGVWWDAVVGHRLRARSAVNGVDWDRFRDAVPRVWPAVVPLAAVAVAGAVALLVGRRRRAPRPPSVAAVLLALWCACAVPAFTTGGQFYEHYWLLLVFPLGCAASVVAAGVTRPAARGAVLAVLLVPCLVSTALIARLPRDQVPVAVGGYGRSVHEEAVAAWYRRTASPGDGLYVLCASASVYAQAHVDPPYPYLWMDAVRSVPGAAPRLAALLSSAGRPRYVVRFQLAAACDPSGRVGAALAANYRRVGAVRGVDVYESVLALTERGRA